MTKKKKVLIISIVLIGISLTLTFFFIRNKDDKKEATNELDTTENLDKVYKEDRCYRDMIKNAFGSWVYMEEYLELELKETQDFQINGWGGPNEIVKGEWEFSKDNGSIILDFNQSDNPLMLENTFEDKEFVSEVFPYINLEENKMTVSIYYAQNQDEYTEECKLDKFYLNFMNLFLYKVNSEDFTTEDYRNYHQCLSNANNTLDESATNLCYSVGLTKDCGGCMDYEGNDIEDCTSLDSTNYPEEYSELGKLIDKNSADKEECFTRYPNIANQF